MTEAFDTSGCSHAKIKQFLSIFPALPPEPISLWGGKVLGSTTTTLNGSLGDNTYGTGGSGTTVNVGSTSGFPSSGTNYFQVGGEEISYTGITATSFTGITRAARGSTRAAHSTGATVTNTSSWTGWGSAAANTDKVTDPGLWSIDNLGDNVVLLDLNDFKLINRIEMSGGPRAFGNFILD